MKLDELFEVTHNLSLNFSVLQGAQCEVLLRAAGNIYPLVTLETADGPLQINNITIKALRRRSFDTESAHESDRDPRI